MSRAPIVTKRRLTKARRLGQFLAALGPPSPARDPVLATLLAMRRVGDFGAPVQQSARAYIAAHRRSA